MLSHQAPVGWDSASPTSGGLPRPCSRRSKRPASTGSSFPPLPLTCSPIHAAASPMPARSSRCSTRSSSSTSTTTSTPAGTPGAGEWTWVRSSSTFTSPGARQHRLHRDRGLPRGPRGAPAARGAPATLARLGVARGLRGDARSSRAPASPRLGVLDDEALQPARGMAAFVDRLLQRLVDPLPADHEHRVDRTVEECGWGRAEDLIPLLLEAADPDQVPAALSIRSSSSSAAASSRPLSRSTPASC